MKVIGVYKVTNNINGHCYIGSSLDIERRWREHHSKPFNKKSADYGFKFYSAIRSYGIKNFTFEILEECKKDMLLDRERYWYELYKPEYNMMYPERKPGTIFKHTEEAKKKISRNNAKYWSGKKLPDSMIQKIIEGNKNKRISVIMLNKDTEEPIKEFNGICNALRYLQKNPNNTNSIKQCCDGARKTAYGYKWKYKN